MSAQQWLAVRASYVAEHGTDMPRPQHRKEISA